MRRFLAIMVLLTMTLSFFTLQSANAEPGPKVWIVAPEYSRVTPEAENWWITWYWYAMAPGVVWGIAGVSLALAGGETPDKLMSWLLIENKPFSVAVRIAILDTLNAPLKIVIFPLTLGLDMLMWTVGLAAWLVIGEGWPGWALGVVLSPRPILAWVSVFLSSVLTGAGLTLGFAWLMRISDKK